MTNPQRFVREDRAAEATEPQHFLRENGGIVAEALGDGVDGGGIWRIRIISAGEGSSGFYPAAVIERDGKRAFPVGTKIFLNHPSYEEAWDRPERDVTKICGVIVGEHEWDATDQSLYANVQFGSAYRTFIDEFHESLGMSIYAYAESEIGTIGEFTGEVVTHLLEHPFNSVDVVTVAGANGAIVKKVSEGFKALVSKGTSPVTESTATIPQPKEITLDAELKEALAELRTQIVAEVTAALTPTVVPDVVEESALEDGLQLVAEADLPKEARAVAFKAVREGTPAVEAIASQTAYVESIKASLAPKQESDTDPAPAGRPAGVTVTTESLTPKGW